MRSKFRLLPIAVSIAMVVTMFVAVNPALAWHVNTQDCESQLEARLPGPSGDPFYRAVVKYPSSCKGAVVVPDEKWVGNGTFYAHPRGDRDTVLGTAQRGESITLRNGDYIGTWSNSDEVERFTIRNIAKPAKVTFGSKNLDGAEKLRRVMDPGCTWRSHWKYVLPLTKMWVQDNTNHVRLITKWAAKAGFYGPLWRGFTPGVTCKAS